MSPSERIIRMWKRRKTEQSSSGPNHKEIRLISAAAESNGAWSELPGELLCLIDQRLTESKDFIRFRAICKPWRETLMANSPRKFKSPVPWLMLPYCRDSAMVGGLCSSGGSRCRLFYDVGEKKFRHIELPENGLGRTVACRGSVSGWVFTLQGGTLLLTNPFTGDRISLPAITAFPDVLSYRPEKHRHEVLHVDRQGSRTARGKRFMEKRFIEKMALSCPPEEEDEECVAMVIRTSISFRQQLAFCKLHRKRAGLVEDEEEGWTLIPRPPGWHCLMDVVFWRGQFYVVDQAGKAFVCDISEPHRPELRSVTDMDEIKGAPSNVYLVTCSEEDELMFVTRYVTDDNPGERNGDYDDQYDVEDDDEADFIIPDSDSDDGHRVPPGMNLAARVRHTTKFRVFRLNEDTKGWDEVDNIGEFALLLGFNTAVRIPTADHPEFARNSIYFTDDLIENHCRKLLGGFDMGIYSLDTRTVQPLYDVSSIHENRMFISPSPSWVIPTLTY